MNEFRETRRAPQHRTWLQQRRREAICFALGVVFLGLSAGVALWAAGATSPEILTELTK